MDSIMERIYQNAIDIQSKALQVVAWINEIRSKQNNIVSIKFDNNNETSPPEKVHLNALSKKEPTIRKPNKTKKETTLNFSPKEICLMPKKIRELFKIGRIKTGIRKRENGSYEIRCQINGTKITASSRFLDEAKLKFIKKLSDNSSCFSFSKKIHKECVQTKAIHEEPKANLFRDYTTQWLEVAKKPYIKESTFKSYMESFNFHIFPKFGDRDLRTIKQLELQSFINDFEDRKRTAKKIYQLLSAVFDYAVADELINRSPMTKVRIPVYEQEHGTPLSRNEEREFIEKLINNNEDIYLQAFVFMFYTGLRRAELASSSIDDKWVTVITAKQRKGKSEKKRRIPISPMLETVLPYIDVKRITELHTEPLTRHFKKLCPKHHLHDLRHTFITRCQECGIQREIVSLWAGHAADSSITSVVYTHLERFDENQLAEIKKYSYIL